MYSILSSATILLSAAAAVVATNAESQPADNMFITDLTISKATGGNTTIQFTVYDPDPLTNKTQVCGASWPSSDANGYPNGLFAVCGNSLQRANFAWNMETYTNMCNFELDISHTYKDPAVGKAPYNWITVFAEANITAPHNLTCKTSGKSRVCAMPPKSTIAAPIYAAVAKKR